MNIEIPTYIGMGKLNPEKRNSNGNETVAEYTLFGDTITKLTLTENSALIEDYCNGKLLGITRDINISRAISNHFNNWSPEDDPRFHLIQERVCSLGNVYFENPTSARKDEQIMSFSPAGRLLIFRLPLPLSPASLREKILDAEPNKEYNNKPIFTYNDAYFSTMGIQSRNGEKQYHKILIFEVTVPLAYIIEATKWFLDKGLVHPEKKFRIIIQDFIYKQTGNVKVFSGNTNDNFQTYALNFKGDKESEEVFMKKDKIFSTILGY